MTAINCIDEYFSVMEERPHLFKASKEYRIVFDRGIIEKYQRDNNIKTGVLYRSKYNILVVDLVEGEGGLYTYERIIPASKNNAVVCVPVMDGKLMLLEQYRHPIREKMLCFPRGFGEDGEEAPENAKKELYEETGAVAKSCIYLGEICPDSGLTSCRCDVFVCEIDGYEPACFSEGIIDVKLYDASTLKEMIGKNMIVDSFTLSAFALYEAKSL